MAVESLHAKEGLTEATPIREVRTLPSRAVVGNRDRRSTISSI
jgi:hypothetical protein